MRAIDADRLQKRFDEKSTNPNYRVNMHNIKSIINNAPTVEAIPKADYENRLKADMVAMLEDLKQDFIAEAYGIEMDCTDYVVNVADIDKVIQQKINALKGDTNAREIKETT